MQKRVMKSYLCFLFELLSIFVKASSSLPRGAHYGNKFVFSFPKGGQNPSVDKQVLHLHMASNERTRVKVQRKTARMQPDEEVVVEPNRETIHPVTLELGPQRLYGISEEAIVVKTDNNKKIVLFAMNTPINGGSEGFLVLPIEALDTYYSFGFWGFKPAETANRLTSRAMIISTHEQRGQVNRIVIITPSVGKDRDWVTPPGPSTRFQELYSGDRIYVQLPPYGVYHIAQHTSKESYKIYSTLPIAVILSNSWYASDTVSSNGYGHMVEMIPPYRQLGHKAHVGQFNWYAVAPESGGTIEGGGGGINRMETSVFKSPGIAGFETVIKSLDNSNKPKPVMVLSTYVQKTSGKSPVLLYLPPVEQYMNYYLFIVPTAPTSLRKRDGTPLPYKNRVIVFGDNMDWSGLKFNGQLFRNSDVKNEPHLAYGLVDNVQPGAHELTHVEPNVNFGVVVTGMNSRGDGYAFPAGLRHALTHQACEQLATHSAGDGVDNDCDGKADEELLNYKDDDNDGETDEDLADERKSYTRSTHRWSYLGASSSGEQVEVDRTTLYVVIPTVLCATLLAVVLVIVVVKREFKTVKSLLNRACGRSQLEAKKPNPMTKALGNESLNDIIPVTVMDKLEELPPEVLTSDIDMTQKPGNGIDVVREHMSDQEQNPVSVDVITAEPRYEVSSSDIDLAKNPNIWTEATVKEPEPLQGSVNAKVEVETRTNISTCNDSFSAGKEGEQVSEVNKDQISDVPFDAAEQSKD